MTDAIFVILTFLAVGFGFAITPIAVSWILGRTRRGKQPQKELQPPAVPDEIPWIKPEEYGVLNEAPYESGMPSVGPWRYLGFEYIIYVILFLIFDIIFVAIIFSLGAWLEYPGFVTAMIFIFGILGAITIFYALKPRKYLKL